MKADGLINQVFLYPRPWILTGAGISTESGIPDFRSSGGMWEKVDPIENFSTWALHNNPQGFFTHGIPMFEQVLAAKPNIAHEIIGELQAKRFVGPVITQNIDSLHQKGGASWIYEVHGHIRTATCMNCRKETVSMEKLVALVRGGEMPPKCDTCGGILKPDVILFGDSMPNDFQDAIRQIRYHETTDNMIIVIGSSLTVSPINTFPFEFEKLAIINNSATALDNNAEFIITGSAGEIMGQIKAKLVELNGGQELTALPAGFVPGRIAAIITDIWAVYTSKNKNNGDMVSKIMADITLAEKLLKNYPEIDKRPLIEKHIIDYCLTLIEKVKTELLADSPSLKSLNGYLPRTLDDIINSHYEGLIGYMRQYNSLSEIIKELVLQLVGLIGLYNYMGSLGVQAFDYNLTGEILDKLGEVIKRYNFVIDIEKALKDF